MKIRNIAIIAHVDHGKTTLVDKLLHSSHTFRENQVVMERAMDSNDIERERGITILAKNTAIKYKDVRINILDTPGHADFGGEVERIMKMVDGVILVVDAYEGTMPQTKFVLKKALEQNLKPVVVINKVDKPSARIAEVEDEVLELFMQLDASDEQLDFKVAYASAVNNTCSLDPNPSTQEETMTKLLDLILEEMPEPNVEVDKPLQFQPALLDYSDFVGRIGIGRVTRGKIKVGQTVVCCKDDGTTKQYRIQKLFTFMGLERVETAEATAGDIIAVTGVADLLVGDTLCDVGHVEPLERIKVTEPTVQMTFGANSSPFSGQEGKFVTGSKIEDRLFRETQRDVSLRVVKTDKAEEWLVSGRGELHLSILIENMRREGFEFQVSRPTVITKEENGVTLEPYEFATLDMPGEFVGSVIEVLGSRKGTMENMTQVRDYTRLEYTIPSRGLIGFNTTFMTLTKGYGIINSVFADYRKQESVNVGARSSGALVSMAQGQVTAYALAALEDRGEMFVEPGVKTYEGMIIGEANKEDDLAVNAVKAKAATNVRSAGKDNTVVLKKPKQMTLESCIEFLNDDELLEITPENIRLRKIILDTNVRKKFDKYNK